MTLMRAIALGIVLTVVALPLGAVAGVVIAALYWIDTAMFWAARFAAKKTNIRLDDNAGLR
jgi:hypothetical protein